MDVEFWNISLGKFLPTTSCKKLLAVGASVYEASFEHLNWRQVVHFLPHFQLLLSPESPIFGED